MTPDDEIPPAVPETTLPPATPAAPQQRYPGWKQALVMFLGGVVLAASACVGFLVSLGGNFERGGDDFWTPVTIILFFAGLLLTAVGFVLLIVRLLRGASARR
jgi:hypothetical protein